MKIDDQDPVPFLSLKLNRRIWELFQTSTLPLKSDKFSHKKLIYEKDILWGPKYAIELGPSSQLQVQS